MKLKDVQTSKEELEPELEVHIKPNPSSGMLYIQSKTPITNIQIFDLQGKSYPFPSPWQPMNTSLNISHLPQGIYFVKIQSNGKTKTHRIIKSS
jgi:hypothetical protein